MKKKNKKDNDELRPEYDFAKLKVVARGPGRRIGGGFAVQLDPEVAKKFPNAKSVNDALRLIIDVAERAETV